jgi:MYXO-CTERM domain-containing protein
MARSLLFVGGAVALAVLSSSATSRAADCFVDSVAGSDTNDGKSETTPLQSPGKIPSGCSAVKFKRGSEFKLDKGVQNLGLPQQMMYSSIKTLTNYGDETAPLPRFVKDHVDGSGGMIQVFSAVTIDGLYLSGSKSANAMSQLADGIGVMLGAGSKLLNSEITLCDIGIMTSGDNVQVLNNYVHDLSISVDAPHGVDPNQVGGAEGIFVNSSHVEVAYNRFINCTSQAEWVTITPDKPRCDGGATEVTVPLDSSGAGGEVTDVHIHHNLSYNSCGFFEVSTMPESGSSYVKGKFTNSIFHDNVMIDSGWISLLQINNTRLSNVTWANNTIVHHYLPTVQDSSGTAVDLNDFGSSYIQAIPFNDTSSGVTGGGELEQGDVYWTNNLWYFDPQILAHFHIFGIDATHPSSDPFLKNIVVTGDKFLTTDPGFVDVTSTTDPSAFDLLGTASAVIDQGVAMADVTTDFLDRPRPYGAALDLGAFEYQGTAPATGGQTGSGGTGGQVSVGGGSGRTSVGGGAQASAGRTGSAGSGGSSASVGGSAGASLAGNGNVGNSPGSAGTATGSGGSATGTGGSSPGSAGAPPNTGTGGSSAGHDGASTALGKEQAGCSCRTASNTTPRASAALFGLIGCGLWVLRRRNVRSIPKRIRAS